MTGGYGYGYRAPPAVREEAPGGVAALVCGILGLTLVPLILSIVAIVLGSQARQAARSQPQRYKADLGNVGFVLGWVSVGLFLLVVGFMVLGFIFFGLLGI